MRATPDGLPGVAVAITDQGGFLELTDPQGQPRARLPEQEDEQEIE